MKSFLTISTILFSVAATAGPITDLGEIKNFDIAKNCANLEDVQMRMRLFKQYQKNSYLRVFPDRKSAQPSTACWLETVFEAGDSEVFAEIKPYFGRVIYTEEYEDLPGEATKQRKYSEWRKRTEFQNNGLEDLTPGGFGGY